MQHFLALIRLLDEGHFFIHHILLSKTMNIFHAKILLAAICFCLAAPPLHAQWSQIFCFDDLSGDPRLWVDTTDNPDNIWHIAPPKKAVLNTANSLPNVIITDSLQHYPIHDTSSFTILHLADCGFAYQRQVNLGFAYWTHTDSLNDQGYIELSADQGSTWVDLLNDTITGNGTNYFPPHPNLRPALTGKSGRWKYTDVSLSFLGPILGIGYHDSVLIRFTFISDGIQDTLDGLMFDDIDISEGCEGSIASRYASIESLAYPNPAQDRLLIQWENRNMTPFQLEIVDRLGRYMLKEHEIRAPEYRLSLDSYPAGLYHYLLLNHETKEGSSGSFVVK